MKKTDKKTYYFKNITGRHRTWHRNESERFFVLHGMKLKFYH